MNIKNLLLTALLLPAAAFANDGEIKTKVWDNSSIFTDTYEISVNKVTNRLHQFVRCELAIGNDDHGFQSLVIQGTNKHDLVYDGRWLYNDSMKFYYELDGDKTNGEFGAREYDENGNGKHPRVTQEAIDRIKSADKIYLYHSYANAEEDLVFNLDIVDLSGIHSAVRHFNDCLDN